MFYYKTPAHKEPGIDLPHSVTVGEEDYTLKYNAAEDEALVKLENGSQATIDGLKSDSDNVELTEAEYTADLPNYPN